MISLGSYNQLNFARTTSVGAYLTDGQEDVLLPKKYVPEGLEIGDSLRVFVYADSEDRPIATTIRPKAVVGEFAPLRVVSVTSIGAFVDWGLPKDLLVPFAEQRYRLHEQQFPIVRIIYDDASKRVIGSTRLSKYLTKPSPDLKVGSEVDILLIEPMAQGIKAIVNNQCSAVLYDDEIFAAMHPGDRRKGFIKKIAPEGGIILSLSPQGYEAAVEKGGELLAMLEKAGGFLPYGDDSKPEEIRAVFGLSKSSFKKLIGTLKREGKIDIEHYGIRSVK